MEEEQLDKMAKVRAAKKPPAYKNIHEDVKALPDDNTLSVKNVKEWEKHNKERVNELKYKIRRTIRTRVRKQRSLHNEYCYVLRYKCVVRFILW